MLSPFPVPIYETRPLPPNLRLLPPMQQLRVLGAAAHRVIAGAAPRYHRSLVRGKLAETSGQTIGLVIQTRTSEPAVVSWDLGESWREVQERMATVRHEFDSPLANLSRWWLRVTKGSTGLPPPQAIISTVGHLGIHNPMSGLFACGGACPLVICAGSETIGFCWDHRVFDAMDAGAFYNPFMEELNNA